MMVPVNDQAEHALRRFTNVLARRWPSIAVAVTVVALVAVLSSLTQTTRYRSEAEVLIDPGYSSSRAVSSRAVANAALLAAAAPVVDAARSAVGAEPDLAVRPDSAADVLYFSATSSDANRAATAANTYAEAFISHRRDTAIAEAETRRAIVEDHLAQIEADLALLGANDADDDTDHRRAILEAQRSRHGELLADLAMVSDLVEAQGAQLVEPAQPAVNPQEPTTRRNFIVALAVGLVLGVAAAFVMERFDTSLRDRGDLEAATGGIPTLGMVPVSANGDGTTRLALDRDEPDPDLAEAFRALRTSLQFLGVDRTFKTIALTSPGAGDGTTFTAANLAVACARGDQRVVLVDCALRQPRVHEVFDLPNHTGFTTVLLGEASLESAAHRIEGEPGLVVITAGPVPPDAADLLGGTRARSLVNSISAQADLVIIDAPPVDAGSDLLVVGGMVDGVVLVASTRHTPRDQVARAVRRLKKYDLPLVGTVLNRARDAVPSLWGG